MRLLTKMRWPPFVRLGLSLPSIDALYLCPAYSLCLLDPIHHKIMIFLGLEWQFWADLIFLRLIEIWFNNAFVMRTKLEL